MALTNVAIANKTGSTLIALPYKMAHNILKTGLRLKIKYKP